MASFVYFADDLTQISVTVVECEPANNLYYIHWLTPRSHWPLLMGLFLKGCLDLYGKKWHIFHDIHRCLIYSISNTERTVSCWFFKFCGQFYKAFRVSSNVSLKIIAEHAVDMTRFRRSSYTWTNPAFLKSRGMRD